MARWKVIDCESSWQTKTIPTSFIQGFDCDFTNYKFREKTTLKCFNINKNMYCQRVKFNGCLKFNVCLNIIVTKRKQ